MNSYLNRAGAPPSTSDDVAMDWMGHPVRPTEMPGMPTEAESAALDSSEGLAADDEFTRLMIRHHAAGSAMAAYAAEHGEHPGVRKFAAVDGPYAAQRDQRDQPPAGRARPARGVACGDPRARAPPHRVNRGRNGRCTRLTSPASSAPIEEPPPMPAPSRSAPCHRRRSSRPGSRSLVSELAANAILHARSQFSVRMLVGPDAGAARGDRPGRRRSGASALRERRHHRPGIGNCRRHVRSLGCRAARGSEDRVV